MKLLVLPLSSQTENTAFSGIEDYCDRHSFSDLDSLRRACADERQNVAVLTASVAGFELRQAVALLRREFQRLPIVALVHQATTREVVQLAKAGADHVHVGRDGKELLAVLREIEQTLSAHPTTPSATVHPWKRMLVGESWPMQVIGHMIRLVGPRNTTVLIGGETGTGKEVVARALHAASPRAQGPMVCVNCAALPQELLEAELFGHVKGAFTGAIAHRVGLIEQANKGTLFLDEIGEMPLNLQTRLLRVLQEREFQRVGSSETVKVDIRVIAASNVDLTKRVKEGKFREDLYYRLRVVPIQLPLLRARKEDIPLLVEHFIDKCCNQERIPLKQISVEALQILLDYEWPGNVRELENTVAMAVALSGDRSTLEVWDFPVLLAPPEAQATPCIVPPGGIDYDKVVTQFRRNLLEQALQTTRWNKTQAALLLGLKRTTLTATLRSLRLCPEDGDATDESGEVLAEAV